MTHFLAHIITMASSKKGTISQQFLFCLAQPPIADIILNYTFSLTTLESLEDIAIQYTCDYPTLRDLGFKAGYKYARVVGFTCTVLNNRSILGNTCPACGQKNGKNIVHYSLHLYSFQKIH